MSDQGERTFNPADHLDIVSGNPFLPAKWRIYWLRLEAPESRIESEPLELSHEHAVFRAKVTRIVDGEIKGEATAHARETAQAFGDYVEKAECIREDTHILTRRGFRNHADISIGEDVLAYDLATDRTVWTPIRRKVVYHDAPVVRICHRDFEAIVTPGHTWAIAATYASRVTDESPRRMRETRNLKQCDRIILSARAPGGTNPLTPDESAILGWLVTDGMIWRGNGDVRAEIYQSKEPQLTRIRDLVGSVARESVRDSHMRTFPTGRTYRCQESHRFALPASITRTLLAKSGIASYADLPAVIPTLTQSARAAMLEAMMDADGDDRGYFGKIAKPGVQEAWQILCTLEGIAVGQARNASAFPVQRMKRRRFVSCQRGFTVSDAGLTSVWCPTTDYGTWVARTHTGQVMITGNTSAIARALGALGYGSELSEDFADSRTNTPQSRQNRPQRTQGSKSARDTRSAPKTSQRPPQQRTEASTTDAQPDRDGPMLEAQAAAIDRLAIELDLLTDDEIFDACANVLSDGHPADLAQLTHRDAGRVIGELQRLVKRSKQ